jgi:hypothetical protein
MAHRHGIYGNAIDPIPALSCQVLSKAHRLIKTISHIPITFGTNGSVLIQLL